jgi:ABC-type sugar transport system permease subunit
MPSIIAMSVWKGLGYNMVFFLEALQAIPGELPRAAAIDGVGAPRRFWSITLPLLRPAMVYLVITSLITAFQNLEFGYASAMASVLFVVLVAAAFATLRLISRGNV